VLLAGLWPFMLGRVLVDENRGRVRSPLPEFVALAMGIKVSSRSVPYYEVGCESRCVMLHSYEDVAFS
jgi:hypothetical protein